MAAILPLFLGQIGYVLLERNGVNRFSLASPAPQWFTQIWPSSNGAEVPFSLAESSPFLENFLEQAESFWQVPQAGFRESGIWIEKTAANLEMPLEAMALYLDGKPFLAIHSPDQQFREQSQVLQTARDALLEHEKLLKEIQKKEILLHCIVHDLSQPLSAMRGSFDCLAVEDDADRIAKFVDLGKNAGERQEAMIREILKAFSSDLHGSQDAEIATDFGPDLLLTAKEAITSLSPAFLAKGVSISLSDNIAQKANRGVRGEKTRLLRVFTNLLENALRYTPAGSTVTIGLEEDGGFLKAYVDDEGPGLPPDLRPAEIFALFAKGKESGGKAGLGLYFCRITVERWGGTINCASLTEKGSRFWFRLPRAVSTTNASPDQKLGAQKSNPDSGQRRPCPGLRILLADDQEDIRALTTHQLTRSGHEVVAVANGQAALDAAKSGRFAVILLDEEMPVLSGVQVAAAIRALQQGQANPSVLVALTGNNTPDDKARLRAAGFDSVIGKPFRMEALDAYLRDPGNLVAVDAPPEDLPGSEEESLHGALQRVGGDEKLLRQMIRTFLRETPTRMEAIHRALQHKKGADLTSVAHALKGSIGIFGGIKAGQQSQSLEYLGSICNFEEAGRVYGILQEEIAKLQQNLRRYAKLEEAETSTGRKATKPKSDGAKPTKGKG
jgi:signal transduction histidine kinase/HPt (histidine-containing phosphotransfer) domain-containing protein